MGDHVRGARRPGGRVLPARRADRGPSVAAAGGRHRPRRRGPVGGPPRGGAPGVAARDPRPGAGLAGSSVDDGALGHAARLAGAPARSPRPRGTGSDHHGVRADRRHMGDRGRGAGSPRPGGAGAAGRAREPGARTVPDGRRPRRGTHRPRRGRGALGGPPGRRPRGFRVARVRTGRGAAPGRWGRADGDRRAGAAGRPARDVSRDEVPVGPDHRRRRVLGVVDHGVRTPGLGGRHARRHGRYGRRGTRGVRGAGGHTDSALSGVVGGASLGSLLALVLEVPTRLRSPLVGATGGNREP